MNGVLGTKLSTSPPGELRRPWTRMARRVAHAWIVAAVVITSMTFSYAAESPDDLKVLWVYNFLRYTDWPSNATANTGPFRVGILGESSINGRLGEITRMKINGRSIEVKKCASLDDAQACHLIYVAASEQFRLPQILAALLGKPVLTVGEAEDFAEQGGVIQLTIGKDKSFEINTRAYMQSKLVMNRVVYAKGKLITGK